jgi:CheY-like chemotaxis protein
MDKIHQLFVQNVSHELRTPLSIILGYTDLLYDGHLGLLSREQQEAISLIRNRGKELRVLVERIGILLALENGHRVSRPVKLAEVVAEVVEQRGAVAAEAEIELDLQTELNLPPVSGDSYQLREAIDALVENGIKFTPPGGHVKLELYPETRPNDNGTRQNLTWICLAVTDTGIGIAEDELEHLFSDFYQVDGSVTRQYGGLGAGLTVVKAVVESHGGQVEVESQPGQGSRFIVRLPPLLPEAQVDVDVNVDSRLQRILIVDDEINVALFLQSALEDLPHCEVEIAVDGKQALSFFEQQIFDLLITDYRMPGTDGIALATEVRERYPQTVVIMITAYADDDLRRSARRVAIHQILDKPVKLAQIRSLISRTLNKSGDH